MKKWTFCGLILVVPFVVLFGILWLVLVNIDDQSALTEEVEVTVVQYDQTRRSNQPGFQIDYAYRSGVQWYAGETFVKKATWQPGETFSACIDPDEPATHALRIQGTGLCGDEFVGFEVGRAEPTAAPDE